MPATRSSERYGRIVGGDALCKRATRIRFVCRGSWETRRHLWYAGSVTIWHRWDDDGEAAWHYRIRGGPRR